MDLFVGGNPKPFTVEENKPANFYLIQWNITTPLEYLSLIWHTNIVSSLKLQSEAFASPTFWFALSTVEIIGDTLPGGASCLCFMVSFCWHHFIRLFASLAPYRGVALESFLFLLGGGGWMFFFTLAQLLPTTVLLPCVLAGSYWQIIIWILLPSTKFWALLSKVGLADLCFTRLAQSHNFQHQSLSLVVTYLIWLYTSLKWLACFLATNSRPLERFLMAFCNFYFFGRVHCSLLLLFSDFLHLFSSYFATQVLGIKYFNESFFGYLYETFLKNHDTFQ